MMTNSKDYGTALKKIKFTHLHLLFINVFAIFCAVCFMVTSVKSCISASKWQKDGIEVQTHKANLLNSGNPTSISLYAKDLDKECTALHRVVGALSFNFSFFTLFLLLILTADTFAIYKLKKQLNKKCLN